MNSNVANIRRHTYAMRIARGYIPHRVAMIESEAEIMAAQIERLTEQLREAYSEECEGQAADPVWVESVIHTCLNGEA
jgi:cytochrome c556